MVAALLRVVYGGIQDARFICQKGRPNNSYFVKVFVRAGRFTTQWVRLDFDISRPVLDTVDGPLSSSNQAIPHMIFFTQPNWYRELGDCYELDETRFGFFTSLAYMVTGGISRVFPIPHFIYQPYLVLDRFLARTLPKLFASFFSVRLVAKR